MNKCKLRIVEFLDESLYESDPDFFDNISLDFVLGDIDLKFKMYREHKSFLYINDNNIICAIIRFEIVKYKDIKYAFIWMVGSRSYFDLTYRGNGRKMFSELFNYLREEEKVSILCILDPTIIGWEMYIKIGFRAVGEDKFLYYMLNDEKITCKDITILLCIINIRSFMKFDIEFFKNIDKYPNHKKIVIYDHHDLLKDDKNRPYYNTEFIKSRTDLFVCDLNEKELEMLYHDIEDGN